MGMRREKRVHKERWENLKDKLLSIPEKGEEHLSLLLPVHLKASLLAVLRTQVGLNIKNS